MRRFLVRRFFFAVIALLVATMFTFSMSRAAGDPRLLYAGAEGYGMTPEHWDLIGKELGLDKPLPVQYLVWLGNILRGNFGQSLAAKQPVTTVIGEKIPATAILGIASWIVATIVGVPLGVLSAVKRGTAYDHSARVFALLGQALPGFWVGIMSILLFAVILDWLPSGTRGEGFSIRHMILPTLVLAWGSAAAYLRLTRSAMLEVLDSEYLKLARAKGVASGLVVWKHAFRNALISPLTYSALLVAGFITGVVVVETVYAWPGLGSAAVRAVWDNDFPVMSMIVILFTMIFVGMNFLADIAYVLIDPRIRYS
jgi:peptide/nickel transport system permease protein